MDFLPFLKRAETIKSIGELKSLLRFYNQAFNLDTIENLFDVRVEKSRLSSSIFVGRRVVIINKEQQLVVMGLDRGEVSPFEYIWPYPKTVGEFINSCYYAGIRLKAREGVDGK